MSRKIRTTEEEVVHRVSSRGKRMGGEYFVLSTTIKLTLVTTEEQQQNGQKNGGFFQHWTS